MNNIGADQILNSSNVADIPVASTATVYTKSFPISDIAGMAVIAKAAGAGVINVLVELEQSDVVPTTEGSADTNYVEAEGMADLLVLNSTTRRIKTIEGAAPVKYARFRLTGQGSNGADVTVNIKLSKQWSD